jgi:hypothetical protein
MIDLFSILGAVIVIIGLYMLLWGKDGDPQVHNDSQEQNYSTYKEQKDDNTLMVTSAHKEGSKCEP